ncbi:TetR/AcrR family transcriptional regulator [Streptomyces sp. MMS24-I2-30]|uniref:TetR/AcrR family transcriptional regulator n=1 Tax=Streptomyces sp. MMS24-I2-30 TaxID=3351564 RepID=UPI0038969D68
MTAQTGAGRTNQKQRTRMAIVAAARELIGTGAEVAMPAIARAALVSEATAYRYFPDLPSLISEALAGVWPPPAEALAPVADSADPVERVAFACEFLLRGVLARQGSVRAMIAATITRPEAVPMRPGIRFGLIEHALLPLEETLGVTDPDAFTQLKRDLAVVVSAEALFTLTDLCGLSPDEAVSSAVRTASALTAAAVCSTR